MLWVHSLPGFIIFCLYTFVENEIVNKCCESVLHLWVMGVGTFDEHWWWDECCVVLLCGAAVWWCCVVMLYGAVWCCCVLLRVLCGAVWWWGECCVLLLCAAVWCCVVIGWVLCDAALILSLISLFIFYSYTYFHFVPRSGEDRHKEFKYLQMCTQYWFNFLCICFNYYV